MEFESSLVFKAEEEDDDEEDDEVEGCLAEEAFLEPFPFPFLPAAAISQNRLYRRKYTETVKEASGREPVIFFRTADRFSRTYSRKFYIHIVFVTIIIVVVEF